MRRILRVFATATFLNLAFVLAVFAISEAAQAQGPSAPCAERATVVATLASQYQEKRRSMGLVSAKALAELFVSDARGTWTVIVTDPKGVSCVLAAGQNWTDIEPPIPGTDS
jgi:hypothetical protein